MPVSTIKNDIVASLKGEVGHPIVTAVNQDVGDVVTQAIKDGSRKYWIHFPHLYREMYDYSSGTGRVIRKSFSSVLKSAISNTTIRKKAYYLGILRCEASPPYSARTQDFYRILLGAENVGPSGFHQGVVDYEKILLDATYNDILTVSKLIK